MKKIIFHAHSTYSHDGKISIASLHKLLSKRKINFLFLSDHFEDLDSNQYINIINDCKKVNNSLLQIIPGYERNWNGIDVCAFGIYNFYEDADFIEWSKKVKNGKGLLCVMHPSKYKKPIPAEILSECDAVEIWNSKWPYDGKTFPYEFVQKFSKDLIPLAGQDIHKKSDISNIVNALHTTCLNYECILREVKEKKHIIKGGFISMPANTIKTVYSFLKIYQPIRRSLLYNLYYLRKFIKRILKR